MSTHNVTIYSTPTCRFCVMSKKYLDEKGIKYRDIDVSQDQQAAMEMVMKSGQMGVPVIDIDGTILLGFQPRAFDQLLA